MSSVRQLHDEAMYYARLALEARDRGNLPHATELAVRAWEIEAEAATRITKEPRSEPTRSILYKSAASLAYQANDFTTAQRLVFEGLSGYPPPTVEQELRDLYDQLNFARHTQIHGISLADDGMQLALAGVAVATGQILYSAFRKRTEAVVALLDRTMRRMVGQPYQRSGQPPESMRPFQPVMAAPRAGSFAITLQMLPRLDQQLPLGLTGHQVIDEVMTGIDLLQRNRDSDLIGRFADERYYRNFVSQAKLLAPDGDGVNVVGLTTNERTVQFTKIADDIAMPVPWPENTSTIERLSAMVRLHGVLDFADARNDEMVGLTTDDGRTENLRVLEGLEDVVRAHFKRNVTIVGQTNGKEIVLIEVRGAD